MKKIFLVTLLIIQAASVCSQTYFTTPYKKVFNKDSLSSYLLQSCTGLSSHLPTSSKKLLVFAFLSPECPLSKNYSLNLLHIKRKYDEQVNFIGILPGNFDTKEILEFNRNYLSSWTLFGDHTLALTQYLQGEVTPEVLVINNQNGFLIYKGAIDDWAVSLGKTRKHSSKLYLDNALNDFLNNKKILISYNKPVGCLINDF